MRVLGIVALSAAVAGCASTPEAPPAVAYQRVIAKNEAVGLILSERSQMWKDPYSLRDARIGDAMTCPTRDNLFAPASSCVCLEVNAKNSYGGYTGIRRTIAVFPVTGGLVTSDGGIKGFEDICQNMTPFPQLNGDYVEPRSAAQRKKAAG